jgi:hypothetical protein
MIYELDRRLMEMNTKRILQTDYTIIGEEDTSDEDLSIKDNED